MKRTDERMLWLLKYLQKQDGFCVAWDEDVVDKFVAAFPEAYKSVIPYMMGANSSPCLNSAAKRAKDRGYIEAGHIGNQDAKQYNQRTWCRTWSLTRIGERFLEEEEQCTQ